MLLFTAADTVKIKQIHCHGYKYLHRPTCALTKKFFTIAAFCRIRDELDLLIRAQHENVVRVFGWTVWDNAVAIIMEYMPAGNLWELLDNKSVDLTPILSLRICKDIADGIAFLHSSASLHAKLVHGDIKAENIFLTENLNCKIGDFGSAQLSVYTGSKTRAYVKSCYTLPPQKRHFTEQYAAPELLNDPSLKRSSSQDTYAYAIIIFEVLERRRPINTDYLKEVYKMIVKDKQRPQIAQKEFEDRKQLLRKKGRKLEIEILETLVKMMKKCWAHDPRNRPSMNENKQNLEVLLLKCHEEAINRDVNEAKRYHDITYLSTDERKFVPISSLSPPDFGYDQKQSKNCCYFETQT